MNRGPCPLPKHPQYPAAQEKGPGRAAKNIPLYHNNGDGNLYTEHFPKASGIKPAPNPARFVLGLFLRLRLSTCKNDVRPGRKHMHVGPNDSHRHRRFFRTPVLQESKKTANLLTSPIEKRRMRPPPLKRPTQGPQGRQWASSGRPGLLRSSGRPSPSDPCKNQNFAGRIRPRGSLSQFREANGTFRWTRTPLRSLLASAWTTAVTFNLVGRLGGFPFRIFDNYGGPRHTKILAAMAHVLSRSGTAQTKAGYGLQAQNSLPATRCTRPLNRRFGKRPVPPVSFDPHSAAPWLRPSPDFFLCPRQPDDGDKKKNISVSVNTVNESPQNLLPPANSTN